MLAEIFYKSDGEIQEIQPARNGRHRIVVEASSETRDSENDKVLADAWTHPDDVAFYKSHGWLDWNHLTALLPRLGAAAKDGGPEAVVQAELAYIKAKIGEPVDLMVTDDRKLRVVGDVYAENPFVKALVPAWKADSNQFGASAAGGFYKPRPETVQRYGEKTWDRARMQHCAICPRIEAKNPDTMTRMYKSVAAHLLGESEQAGEQFMKTQAAVEAAPTPADAFMVIVRDYLFQRADFAEYIYNDMRNRIIQGEPSFEIAVAYFRGFGVSLEKSQELAGLAIMHMRSAESGE